MKYRRVEGESTTRVNTDQLQVADKEKSWQGNIFKISWKYQDI